MSRLFRNLLLVLALLAGLGLLWGFIENARGRRALQAAKSRLRAAGERLTLEQLIPPASAEARNAGRDLVSAANQLRPGALLPNNPPHAMGFASQGRATVSSLEARPGDSRGGTTNTWENLAADLEQNADVLEKLRGILRQPDFDMGLNYKEGFSLLLPHLAKLKVAANWLAADAIHDLHRRELDRAGDSLVALAALSRLLRQDRVLISQLVGIAVQGVAFSPTWEALQHEGWPDARLADLQQGWASMDSLEPFARAMEMDRAGGIELFAEIRSSSAKRRQFFSDNLWQRDDPSNTANLLEFAVEFGQAGLGHMADFGKEQTWAWIWSHWDEKAYLEVLQSLIDVPREVAAGKPFVEIHRALQARTPQGRADEPVRPHLLLTGLLTPVLDKASLKVARAQATRDLMVAAIALKRHRLRHGTQAPTLADLVPEYLPSVPLDLMDGKPLRYASNSDGTFLLYSVNEDGVDDGGNPKPPDSASKVKHIGAGRDLVWPLPARTEP